LELIFWRRHVRGSSSAFSKEESSKSQILHAADTFLSFLGEKKKDEEGSVAFQTTTTQPTGASRFIFVQNHSEKIFKAT
jgi:hypothetical protein